MDRKSNNTSKSVICSQPTIASTLGANHHSASSYKPVPKSITTDQLTQLQRYASLRARRIIRRYGHNGIVDADDIAQELFLRVWERIHHFNAARSMWSTFCEMVIRQGIQQIWERQIKRSRRQYDPLRGKRLHPHTHHGMTSESGDEFATNTNPFREWELEHDVTVLISLLEGNERIVAEYLSRGSWAGAARELGVSRRQLQAIARRLRSLVMQMELRQSRSQ